MDKIALITGGSKGIGKALAMEFAKHGYSLLLVARGLEQLHAVQKEVQNKYECEVKILSADLEKRESIDLIMNTFKEEIKNLDVLVNNAGFGKSAKFTDTPIELIDGMMAVNIVTLVDLTHRILPLMLAKKRGKILNVASTAAFTPGPFMAIYYASKAFVYSFSMAIAEEYKKDGISISALCPGVTETEFFNRAGEVFLRKTMKSMKPEKVAQIAYKGLMKGKRMIVPGVMNKVTLGLMTFTPRNLKTKITGVLNKTKSN